MANTKQRGITLKNGLGRRVNMGRGGCAVAKRRCGRGRGRSSGVGASRGKAYRR